MKRIVEAFFDFLLDWHQYLLDLTDGVEIPFPSEVSPDSPGSCFSVESLEILRPLHELKMKDYFDFKMRLVIRPLIGSLGQGL